MATAPLVPAQIEATLQTITLSMGLNLSTDPRMPTPEPVPVEPIVFVGSATESIEATGTTIELVVAYESQQGNSLLLFTGGTLGPAAAVTSVVDSAGNIWQRLVFTAASAARVECWFVGDAQPISSVTVTFAGASTLSGYSVGLSEYENVAGGAINAVNSGGDNSPASVTQGLQYANDFIVAGFFTRGRVTFYPGGEGNFRYTVNNGVTCSLGSGDATGSTSAEVTLNFLQPSQLWFSMSVELVGQQPMTRMPPNDYGVRIDWQPEGQPFQKREEDVAYLRAIEVDDQYNRVRDVNYSTATGEYVKTTNYTRVWEVYWTVYGPNSFDNARKLRSRLFDQDIHDQFAQAQLYFVTDPSAPRRVPENLNGQWWERVDFAARFNEFVTEQYVTQPVSTVGVILEDEFGNIIAEIDVNAAESGDILTEGGQIIELEGGGGIQLE